jgi:hypothetical protein
MPMPLLLAGGDGAAAAVCNMLWSVVVLFMFLGLVKHAQSNTAPITDHHTEL